jgi:hypothetical protein
MFWVGIFVGLMIGGSVGAVTMAVCATAKESNHDQGDRPSARNRPRLHE